MSTTQTSKQDRWGVNLIYSTEFNKQRRTQRKYWKRSLKGNEELKFHIVHRMLKKIQGIPKHRPIENMYGEQHRGNWKISHMEWTNSSREYQRKIKKTAAARGKARNNVGGQAIGQRETKRIWNKITQFERTTPHNRTKSQKCDSATLEQRLRAMQKSGGRVPINSP